MRLLLVLLFISAPAFSDDFQKLLSAFESIGNGGTESCLPPFALKRKDRETKLLEEKKWFSGAPDCDAKDARTPPYEVLKLSSSYYVMRQNKCINFEAPFLYLYIGEEAAFLLDTGSTGDPETMPLRKWVDEMLKNHPKKDEMKLIVAHSHSHGDHTAGDEQFIGRPNTTVIGTEPKEVAAAFGIKNWPNENGTIDLGGRELSIIPIPGHEESSIAVYDHKTGDLLTGDTLYPGNIFLSRHSWPEFKDSISRLHAFSQKHKIRNILGAHIEMSSVPGQDFPYGTTHQPNEHKLPLKQEHLNELKTYIDQHPRPLYKKFDSFIINL